MSNDLKLLTHVDSEIELNMLKGLFQDNGITILEKKQGTGAYLSVVSGFNFQGTDISVAEADYDQSIELLKVLQNVTPIDENDKWEDGYKDEYESKKRKFSFIVIIIPIIIFLLGIIGSMIINSI